MADAPLFMTYRKRENTLKFLLIGLAASFLWGVLSIGYAVFRMSATSGGGLDRLFGVLGGALVLSAAVGAAVVTGALYLIIGRRSGDRGGLMDYAANFAVALVTPVVILALLGASAAIGGRPLQEAYEEVWLEYSAEINADSQAFEASIRQMNENGLMSPGMMARDPGYRKTRAMLEEGRAMVGRYQSLSDQRRREARAKLAAHPDPRVRLPALKMWDDAMAVRKPAEDSYWSLHEQVVDSGDAMVTVLARSPGRWQGEMYLFNRQKDLDDFNIAVADRREVERRLQSQARAINSWEQGQQRR